nr:NADP-specific isocitrate dehydrogenase peptide V [swine, heart, Peptide Partial, 10 aa] [Sus scrofa]
SSGGFVWACK